MEHKCKNLELKPIEKCELNRDQVIKGLECCYGQELEHNENCPECPYTDSYPDCAEYLGKYALALINELTVELDAMRGAANSYKMHNEKLTEENERLKASTVDYRNIPYIVADAKADTVQKVLNMVAVHFGTYTDKDTVKVLDVVRLVDQIADKMLEGDTDGKTD